MAGFMSLHCIHISDTIFSGDLIISLIKIIIHHSRIIARTPDGKEIIPSREESYFFTIGKSEVSGILDACNRNIVYVNII
jgi:hypothetical protein